MTSSRVAVLFSALLICSAAAASDTTKKKAAKAKTEIGASCKAPAVGPCAACSITCRPGEAATCKPGQVAMDACHIQPSCKCTR